MPVWPKLGGLGIVHAGVDRNLRVHQRFYVREVLAEITWPIAGLRRQPTIVSAKLERMKNSHSRLSDCTEIREWRPFVINRFPIFDCDTALERVS